MRIRREAAAGIIAVTMGALMAPQIPRTMPVQPVTEEPSGQDVDETASPTGDETKPKDEAIEGGQNGQAEEDDLGHPEPVENESPDGLPDLPDMPTVSLGEDNGMPEVSEEVLEEDGQSTFVMPEGVDYDPDVAIFSLEEGVSLDEANARLAELDGIEPVQVTEEDVEAGYVMVEVSGECSMEDTINELLRTGVVSTAQPDYAYPADEMIDAEKTLVSTDETKPIEPADNEDDGVMGEQPIDTNDQKDQPVDKEEQEDEDPKPADTHEPSEQDGNDAQPVDMEEMDEEPITAASEEELSEKEGIEPAEEADETGDSEVEGATNDPFCDVQWGLDDIRACGAWQIHGDNSGVTVAVIDAGFFVDHEDLAGNIYRRGGRPVTYDAANDKEYADVTPLDGLDSITYQHGTHVAGIIGAVASNGKGIAGAGKNVKVLPISVVDSERTIKVSSVLRALAYVKQHARDYNIKAVNVSLGHATTPGEKTTATDSAYKQVYDAGVVIASAAGNFGSDSDGKAYGHYPSDCPYGVAVIALSPGTNPKRASFSNYNRSLSDHKDMSAPGDTICSTIGLRNYGAMSGTSMAAPFVSATAAMVFAANPNLTAQQVIDILHSTARDLGPAGYDLDYGYGEVDAYSAVKAALKGAPTPSKPSQPGQPSPAENDAKAARCLSYRTHVQSYGWLGWQGNGGTAGTTGQSKRMEGIQIKLQGAPYSGGIRYRTHCQSIGWQGWVSDGALGGTTGQSKRMEAIQIELTGEMANHYDVWYRTHAQNYGWLGWTSNGQRSGTSALGLRLEAIEIRIQPKGKGAPGNTGNSYHTHFVRYQSHIQANGWLGNAYDGGTSGSTGQSKRMEGIMISLVDQLYSGGIRYRAHCAGIGWQGWVENGALAGTTGQARRMEAIQIELTGDMANHYDVWYRVHSATYGWLGWTKNGAVAGTTGLAKRAEAVEIVLTGKGGNAPGSTSTPYRHN